MASGRHGGRGGCGRGSGKCRGKVRGGRRRVGRDDRRNRAPRRPTAPGPQGGGGLRFQARNALPEGEARTEDYEEVDVVRHDRGAAKPPGSVRFHRVHFCHDGVCDRRNRQSGPTPGGAHGDEVLRVWNGDTSAAEGRMAFREITHRSEGRSSLASDGWRNVHGEAGLRSHRPQAGSYPENGYAWQQRHQNPNVALRMKFRGRRSSQRIGTIVLVAPMMPSVS